MENQKEILREIETDLQQVNTKDIPAVEKTEALVEDHHSKKHIGIIIVLTVLLVAILIIIAIVFRPSQEPEDVIGRLEDVSQPVTQTAEEITAEMEALSATRTTRSIESLPQEERDAALAEAQRELEALGSL